MKHAQGSPVLNATSLYQRLFEIDRALRAGDGPTARHLADRLGVTPRTIRRDIRVMRERFGAPIAHEKGRGYCYQNLAYPGPALPFLEVQSLVALVSRQVLTQFQGTFHNHRLGSVVRRLSQSLHPQIKSIFTSDGLPLADPVMLRNLEEAIREARTVGLKYYHASADALLQVAVRPVRVEGESLVAGMHHGRPQRRFRIDRIHPILITPLSKPA